MLPIGVLIYLQKENGASMTRILPIKQHVGILVKSAVLSGDRISNPYIKAQKKKAETIKDELLRRFNEQAQAKLK